METGKGEAQCYNEPMGMGMILLNTEPRIIPPGWWQDTAVMVK